ncbi:MAG: flagellar protein FlaG [Thermoproteota archaeon]
MKIDGTRQYLVSYQKDQSSRFEITSNVQRNQINKANHEDQKENSSTKAVENNIFEIRAVFSITEDKDVVIKLLNEKGEVIGQIPPEEFLNMVKKLKEVNESLFSRRV